MTWHYASGANRYGPVDDADIDRLLASGEITPDTLVWRAGMAEWRPLREARAAAIVGAAAIRVAETPAAAVRPPPTIDPGAAIARIAAEGRRVAILDSLRRGWALVFADPGPSIGVSALVLVTMIGAGLVPCVGSIAQLVVTGPLVAAWYLYFVKRIRGLPTEWGDAFAGFSSPMFPQLVLQQLVSLVATLVAMAPVFIVMFVSIFGLAAAASADERLTPLAFFGLGLLFLVSFAGMIYLSIVWMFAPALILDKNLDFWPAMTLSWRVTTRQFFPILGLLLLCALVYLTGLLALCVGIFVALPVCVASLAYVYEDLFGDTPAR
jgi:uncharacterized membrane protein